MTENTETVSRIPLARSVVYTVRGAPEIDDGYSGEHTIAPTEISLTYRLAADGQPGSVHAYVAGWWMRGAVRVPVDKPVGRHFPGRTFADWPAWLAEEARLHDPAVVVRVPDTSQTTAAEPSDPTQCGGEEGFCPEHGFHRHSLKQPGDPVPDTSHTAREQLLDALDFSYCLGLGYTTPEMLLAAYDASRTALPAPSDRAAVDAVRELHQPMERGPFTICAHCSGWDGKQRCLGVVTDYPCPTLRAMAEPPADDAEHVGGGANAEDCPACSGTNPPYPFLCPAEAAVPAAVSGRTDDETGATLVAASGPRANAATPAVGGAHSCRNCEGIDPDTCLMNPDRPKPVPVHAVPLPGSNGISSCCGRTPCEFVGERVTRNPDEVTCPAALAVGGAQPKEAGVVAYRNSHRPGVLLCREHGDGWGGLTPLTAEDLPDGGLCTYGDPADPADVCGVDVLILQQPKGA
jgi:hypothetical protein